MSRRPAKKKTSKPQPRRRKTPGRAKKAPAKGSGVVSLGEPQIRWLDSVAESIAATGGPRFTRSDILQALVDANTARTVDPAVIRSPESLRVAFGALDLSSVERQLSERPRLESSVLDALKDSIK